MAVTARPPLGPDQALHEPSRGFNVFAPRAEGMPGAGVDIPIPRPTALRDNVRYHMACLRLAGFRAWAHEVDRERHGQPAPVQEGGGGGTPPALSRAPMSDAWRDLSSRARNDVLDVLAGHLCALAAGGVVVVERVPTGAGAAMEAHGDWRELWATARLWGRSSRDKGGWVARLEVITREVARHRDELLRTILPRVAIANRQPLGSPIYARYQRGACNGRPGQAVRQTPQAGRVGAGR